MKQRRSIPINDGMPEDGNDAGTNAPSPQTTAESQAEPPPRRSRADRANAFAFSAWLLEGLEGLNEELRHTDLGLPQAFWTHAYAARREALFAVRVLIDAALARCETDRSQQNEEAHKQRGRVDIDFS